MSYADITRGTSERLKRAAHAPRLESAASIIPLSEQNVVLDYGCGDGGFFEHINAFVPTENLYGYEPYLLNEMTFVGATTYDDDKKLVANHTDFFDTVFCMEVCEHLTDEALHVLFKNIRAVATDNARFVFGVPLETGLSGFMKNLYRVAHNNRQHATLSKAIHSLLSIPIPRANDPTGWIGSHIGFDYRHFVQVLNYGGFKVVHRHCLPWPYLGSRFNNEIYYVCERNRRYRD